MTTSTLYEGMERGSAFVAGPRAGLSGDELLFISRLHYRGASGTAIARMLNRSVPDVEAIRARLDPMEVRLPVVELAPEPVPEPAPVIAPPADPGFTRLKLVRAPSETMADIAAHVAQMCGVRLDELRGPSRYREIVRPRQAAFHACYAVLQHDGTHRFSLPQIGRYFGGRDHTTVLHGIRQHDKRVAEARAA